MPSYDAEKNERRLNRFPAHRMHNTSGKLAAGGTCFWRYQLGPVLIAPHHGGCRNFVAKLMQVPPRWFIKLQDAQCRCPCLCGGSCTYSLCAGVMLASAKFRSLAAKAAAATLGN